MAEEESFRGKWGDGFWLGCVRGIPKHAGGNVGSIAQLEVERSLKFKGEVGARMFASSGGVTQTGRKQVSQSGQNGTMKRGTRRTGKGQRAREQERPKGQRQAWKRQ